jgi:hypothetical protein
MEERDMTRDEMIREWRLIERRADLVTQEKERAEKRLANLDVQFAEIEKRWIESGESCSCALLGLSCKHAK